MGNSHRPKSSLGESIYTLAQSGTDDNIFSPPHLPNLVVNGNGTDVSDPKKLHGKAKRKLISQSIVRHLVDAAKECGNYEQAKQYWNAWHCQSNLIKSGGRTYGNYCKTRWCLVCQANRKATLIKKYSPTLGKWEDPHFVTLTIKAVPANKLNKWIKEGMKKSFKLIRDKYKKRYKRGTSIKLMGVKSLECNYNPVKKTYNPHYHIIVPNRETALILKKEWQLYWTKKHTYHGAQYIRKVGNMEKDLIEIIKYGSKIFTEPDMIKKGKNKIPPKIYAAALHNIFVAMKGHRIFDKFGFELEKTEIAPIAKQQILIDYEEIFYDSMAKDWVNYDTGELLTKFIPDGRLEYLLRNRIDKEMQ